MQEQYDEAKAKLTALFQPHDRIANERANGSKCFAQIFLVFIFLNFQKKSYRHNRT